MFKTKKILASVCLMPAILLLSSCALKDTLFSDTGTRLVIQRDKEEYLDVAVLASTEAKTQTYETAVLNYGTFVVSAREATYNRDFYTTAPIRAKVESGTSMTYVETLVANYQFVTPETEIARVETRVDPVDIQAAEIKLTRLRERYQRAKNEYAAQRSADIENNNSITDTYEKRAAEILLERSALEWQNISRSYERQIEDATEELNKLRTASETTVITAGKSGNIVLPTTPYRNGDIIEDGDVVCSLISLDDLYFVADNANLTYRYGMDFQFHVTLNSVRTEDWQGNLIVGTSADLYGNLDGNKAYFQIDMPEGTESRRITNGKIQGDLITMEHVLLVPAKAVTTKGGQTFVTVQKEDGTFLETGFVAGGSNSAYYWVLGGLDEGTTVLVKK